LIQTDRSDTSLSTGPYRWFESRLPQGPRLGLGPSDRQDPNPWHKVPSVRTGHPSWSTIPNACVCRSNCMICISYQLHSGTHSISPPLRVTYFLWTFFRHFETVAAVFTLPSVFGVFVRTRPTKKAPCSKFGVASAVVCSCCDRHEHKWAFDTVISIISADLVYLGAFR